MNKLGLFLQKKIKELGWTQSRFAKKAGVSTSLVSRTISGAKDAPPKAEFVKKMAAALNEPDSKLLRLAGYLTDSNDIAIQISESRPSYLSSNSETNPIDVSNTPLEDLDPDLVQKFVEVIRDDPYQMLFFDDILSASKEEREMIVRDWIKIRKQYKQGS
ncbi:Helix-turn-helix [Seinonella peptonophila]|uniref:Helix-turn-helix n=1 Tax=Seinonella peptonophila TaxID=112248 RepID=A0A1M5AY88_9BACL|nr:helix-turn-helix transcriptional regulator [Seinonella peptonophila]SHF35234.1 Helix-turn-helix [Seinonella peptonophila]